MLLSFMLMSFGTAITCCTLQLRGSIIHACMAITQNKNTDGKLFTTFIKQKYVIQPILLMLSCLRRDQL